MHWLGNPGAFSHCYAVWQQPFEPARLLECDSYAERYAHEGLPVHRPRELQPHYPWSIAWRDGPVPPPSPLPRNSPQHRGRQQLAILRPRQRPPLAPGRRPPRSATRSRLTSDGGKSPLGMRRSHASEGRGVDAQIDPYAFLGTHLRGGRWL
jgi:hypothetical protein